MFFLIKFSGLSNRKISKQYIISVLEQMFEEFLFIFIKPTNKAEKLNGIL